MTFDELMRKVLDFLPDAQFEEDNYGQIIVYTDLEETPNGQLRKFEPPDDYGDCDEDPGRADREAQDAAPPMENTGMNLSDMLPRSNHPVDRLDAWAADDKDN